MASQKVSLVLADDLRLSVEWREPSEEKEKDEHCFVVSDLSDYTRLHSRFLNHTAFPKPYLLKSFPERTRACDEKDCLKKLWETPYFHYYPWVYDSPLTGQVEPSIPGLPAGTQFFLVLEYINTDARNPVEYFREVYKDGRDTTDAVLSLYQFCNAFSQVLAALRKMHEIDLYHCDIKPENILFKNNLLKIIDFDGANFRLRQKRFFGTSRYLPGDALDRRGRGNYLFLRELDFRLAATTFLMAFIEGFPEIVRADKHLAAIEAEIREKEIAYGESKQNGTDPYPVYKRAYQAIKPILSAFSRTDNPILKAFSVIGLEPEDRGIKYEDYLRTTEMDIAALFTGNTLKAWLKLLEPGLWSSGEVRENVFMHNMNTLLTSFTSNIFSNYYPLVYLTYSHLTGWYDEPAATASTHALNLLRDAQAKELDFIDVGSAFGSSAYGAFECGFTKGTLLDNSPVFSRLADLLWSGQTMSEAWKNEVNSLLHNDILRIYQAIFGESSIDEAGKQTIKTIEETARRFGCHREKVEFRLREYWSLHAGDLRYSYVLCNNMIHWPLQSFRAMQKLGVLPNHLDLAGNDVMLLLKPMLRLLRSPGVLIIIEPTLFFVDDENPQADQDYYAIRHNEQTIYRDVLREVHSSILPDIFGISPRPDEHPRQPWFRYSEIRKAVNKEFPGFSIRLLKAPPYPARQKDWTSMMTGAFVMNIRRLPEEEIHKLLNGTVRQWVDFYERFRGLVRARLEDVREPLDTFYFVEIGKDLPKTAVSRLPAGLSVCEAAS